MKVLPIACCVFVLSQSTAFAQAPTMCDLRIGGSFSAGGSLGLAVAESNIAYTYFPNGNSTQVDTTHGRSWSGEFLAPVTPGWAVRVDAAHGGLNAERRWMTPPRYDIVERTPEGEVTVRHITAGVVHALSDPRRPCGYAGAGAGLYEFDYRGQRARNGGIFALAGIEIGVGERSGVAFEVQLHAVGNNDEGALRAEVVLMLRPTAVFRIHF